MRYELRVNFFPCEEIDRNMIFIGRGLRVFTLIVEIPQSVISVYEATAVIEKMSFQVVFLSPLGTHTLIHTHRYFRERGAVNVPGNVAVKTPTALPAFSLIRMNPGNEFFMLLSVSPAKVLLCCLF